MGGTGQHANVFEAEQKMVTGTTETVQALEGPVGIITRYVGQPEPQ